MKVRLIGISSMYPEDAIELASRIQQTLVDDRLWNVHSYLSIVEKLAMQSLNAVESQIQSPAYLDSYLGDEWSYIREERFVSGGDEVSRKPVRYYMTPRQIVQRLRGLGREIHSNFWVNALLGRYNSDLMSWVITDVNYPNEADAILDRDGILIRLDRANGKIDHVEKRKAKEQSLGVMLKSYPHFDERFLKESGMDNIVTTLVNKYPCLTKNTK